MSLVEIAQSHVDTRTYNTDNIKTLPINISGREYRPELTIKYDREDALSLICVLDFGLTLDKITKNHTQHPNKAFHVLKRTFDNYLADAGTYFNREFGVGLTVGDMKELYKALFIMVENAYDFQLSCDKLMKSKR